MDIIPRATFEKAAGLMEYKAERRVRDMILRPSRETETCLYSSLTPYAMVMSGSSAITALAAAFMSSRARLSFGFSNSYLVENLSQI